MHRRRFFLVFAAAAIAMAASGSACKSRPIREPTLNVSSIEPRFDESKGFVARVHGTAHNPNAMALPVRRVRADVTVGGQRAADVQATSVATLAPNADTPVDFDVTVPWSQMALLASRTGTIDPIAYEVDGRAWVGTDAAQVAIPFRRSGTVRKADILVAALKFSPVDIGRLRRDMDNRGR